MSLDIARVLTMPIDSLSKTDVPESVLASLEALDIRSCYLFGRRGPVQASYTAHELNELISLPHLECSLLNALPSLSMTDKLELDLSEFKSRKKISILFIP